MSAGYCQTMKQFCSLVSFCNVNFFHAQSSLLKSRSISSYNTPKKSSLLNMDAVKLKWVKKVRHVRVIEAPCF